MKARVKSQDHINLDGISLGTASIMVRALKFLVEYEAGNEVTAGLGVTAQMELENAIEEAESMKDGVSKELRKKRRDEKKAEAKSVKSEIPESLQGKSREELESMLDGDSTCESIEGFDALIALQAMDKLEAEAEAGYQESHIENQAGYPGSDQHNEDLAAASADRCD